MSGVSLVRLELSPSYRLAALVVGLHALAGGCIYAVSDGGVGMILAALTIVLGGAAAWDRALLRGARSPRTVELRAGGPSEVRCSGGMRVTVREGPRRVNRFWVTLPLRDPMRRSLLVAADMLDPGEFRLLRLWALWGRLPGVAPGQLKG